MLTGIHDCRCQIESAIKEMCLLYNKAIMFFLQCFDFLLFLFYQILLCLLLFLNFFPCFLLFLLWSQVPIMDFFMFVCQILVGNILHVYQHLHGQHVDIQWYVLQLLQGGIQVLSFSVNHSRRNLNIPNPRFSDDWRELLHSHTFSLSLLDNIIYLIKFCCYLHKSILCLFLHFLCYCIGFIFNFLDKLM